MENISSSNFQKIFLLAFTKELIRHSGKQDIIRLQRIIELEEGKKEKIPSTFEVKQNIPQERLEELKEILKVKKERPVQIISPVTKQIIPQKRPIARAPLIIPEPRLPAHLEYLRPTGASIQKAEIDLQKINPLISDPAVRTIEGNPDDNVVVAGSMGTKPTGIILTKEEIDEIIDKFSKTSKIPVTEGVYRVVVGNLVLSAVISKIVGSRFVIRKMVPQRPTSQTPQIPAVKSNNFGAQRFF